jgi:hypothetical protein
MVDDQAGFFLHGLGQAVGPKLVAEGRRTPVLPDNCVVHRFARLPIPDDGGFALVGDADGRNVTGPDVGAAYGLSRHADLRERDLVRVVLDPAGWGKIWVNSSRATDTTLPEASMTSARELVVPWSRARR